MPKTTDYTSFDQLLIHNGYQPDDVRGLINLDDIELQQLVLTIGIKNLDQLSDHQYLQKLLESF